MACGNAGAQRPPRGDAVGREASVCRFGVRAAARDAATAAGLP